MQIGEIGKKIKYSAVLPMGQMVFTIGQMGKSGGFAGRCVGRRFFACVLCECLI